VLVYQLTVICKTWTWFCNKLDEQSSCFVKVEGAPSAFLFRPQAEGDEAEVYRVRILN
jgi:hypothetical protein